jgi:acetolactate synthase I/III small subunit
MLQTISVLLENKPGALMRVTGLLTQRGFNIESLIVAKTVDPDLSRICLTVEVEEKQRPQIIKQITKLINVLETKDLTEIPSVSRELALITIKANKDKQRNILKEASIYNAIVVDAGEETMALQITSDSEKIDTFIENLRSYGEFEVTRTGPLAIALAISKLKLSAPLDVETLAATGV